MNKWHSILPAEGKAPALIYLGKEADQFKSLPHKKVNLRGQEVNIFRHDYKTWLALSNLGFDPPSPMRYYAWPGRWAPRYSQKVTVDFFLKERQGFCLNGIGTGKTLSALWAMDALMKAGEVRRVLIVAPKTLCKLIWNKELFKTFPWIRQALLRGTRKDKQAKAVDTRNQVLIINPESLHLVQYQIPDLDLVIVDEFTKFKRRSTRRHKALEMVSKGRRLWMLSATPAPQSPMDAYGPIKLVNKSFPFVQLEWQYETMVQLAPQVWEPKAGVEKLIYKYMQPAVRFAREECYDLDPLQDIPIEIDLTPWQKQALKELEKEGVTMVNGKEVNAVNAGVFFQKAQQIISGFAYDELHDPQPIGADPLYEVVEELIESSPDPVIVFAPFRGAVDLLQVYLTKKSISCKKIHGDVPQSVREEYFDEFCNRKVKALVAVPGTMSHGLDLTESHVLIWTVAPTSFEEYIQAQGRVQRSGQTRQVINYQIMSHFIGRKLFKRISNRETLQGALLDLFQHGMI